jgi:hypothetical protein
MSKLHARVMSFLHRAAPRIRHWPFGWLAILIAGELVLAQRQLYVGLGFDESYFLYEGWAVNHHLVPYRDFTEFKPPVLFWMNGLAQKLFGVQGAHYRWMFVLLLVLSTGSLFLVLCRRGAVRPLAFLAAAAVAYALLAPHLHDSGLDDSETIGMELFLLGVAALLWTGRGVEIAGALGGALLALVVLSKEPYAPAVVATWATLGFVARDDRVLDWRRYAKLTLLGVAAVAVPVLLYLAVNGAIPFYVRNIRVYFHYVKEIGCSHPHSLRELFLQAWPRLTEKLLIRDMLESSVPLLVAFAVLPAWGLATRVGLVLAVLGGLYAVTVGGCYWNHYFVMGLAGLSLWIVLGALALSRHLDGASRDLRRWAVWAIMAGVVVHMGPIVEVTARSLPAGHAPENLTSLPPWILAYVKQNTTPADYVLTDGGPEFYVITGRKPPTREVCFLDELIDDSAGRTDEERLATVRQELRARPPKVVYLSPDSVSRKVRTRHALIEPFLRDLKYRSVAPDLYVRP